MLQQLLQRPRSHHHGDQLALSDTFGRSTVAITLFPVPVKFAFSLCSCTACSLLCCTLFRSSVLDCRVAERWLGSFTTVQLLDSCSCRPVVSSLWNNFNTRRKGEVNTAISLTKVELRDTHDDSEQKCRTTMWRRQLPSKRSTSLPTSSCRALPAKSTTLSKVHNTYAAHAVTCMLPTYKTQTRYVVMRIQPSLL